MWGWTFNRRNLPEVDYNESSEDEDQFVSPLRPPATRAGSPHLLSIPTLSDNVDEELNEVSNTLRNIGHTKTFRKAQQKDSASEDEEVIEGKVSGPGDLEVKDQQQPAIMVHFDQENGDDDAGAI